MCPQSPQNLKRRKPRVDASPCSRHQGAQGREGFSGRRPTYGAIEEFSQELALVVRRFLRLKDWKDTQRIAVGGGFRASQIGELVIGRRAVILKADKVDVALSPIHNHPMRRG